MLIQSKKLFLMLLILAGIALPAQAGLILFTDRDQFELAVGGPLAFEGFNDNSLATVEVSTTSNFNPYRTTTSHVSEGEKALSIFERDTLNVEFGHDVFAIGFDLNELNASNLSYSDSAGHEILDALTVTEIWNASTFFGLISDTAISSFSLMGNGDQSLRATYGFDALTYTAPAVAVPTPSSFIVLMTGLMLLISLTLIGRQSN